MGTARTLLALVTCAPVFSCFSRMNDWEWDCWFTCFPSGVFHFPTSNVMLPTSLQLRQHLALLVLLILASPCLWWCLLLFICIPWCQAVGQLLTCLLATLTSTLVNGLFKSFAHFKNLAIFLIIEFRKFFMYSGYKYMICNYFTSVCGFYFHFLNGDL